MDKIKFYDTFGRELEVSSEVWKSQILPQRLKGVWDDPEGLHNVIMLSLKDGINEEMLVPSERLIEIDPVIERSTLTRSMVLISINKYDEAEALLNNFIEAEGETAVILTQLAKIYSLRSDNTSVESTLWKAVELDPNYIACLEWWSNLQYEVDGNEGYLKALEKAAEIKNCWRPQLLLGNYEILNNNLSKGMYYYYYVFNKTQMNEDILSAISGSLGKKGFYKELIEFVEPAYNVNIHGFMPGLNLLYAYIQTGDFEKGKNLIKALYKLNRPDIRGYLDNYAVQLEAVRPKSKEDFHKGTPEMVMMNFDKPTWYYSLNNPEWLLPKNKGHLKIGFFSLANISEAHPDNSSAMNEDTIGRLTRSIPMFFSEYFQFNTNTLPTSFIPVAKNVGPIVSGAVWDINILKQMLGNAIDVAVIGSVRDSSEHNIILSLELWDLRRSYKIKDIKLEFQEEDLGSDILSTVKELVNLLTASAQIETIDPPDFYKINNPSVLNNYLITLNESLVLTLIGNGLLSKEGLLGERNIYDDLLNLSLDCVGFEVPKIMFLSALIKGYFYGSEVLDEYRDKILGLISFESSLESSFYKLTPLIYKIFGLKNFFEAYNASNSDKSKTYLEWLQGSK